MYFDKGFDTFNLNKVFNPLMKKVILSVRGVSGFLKVEGKWYYKDNIIRNYF